MIKLSNQVNKLISIGYGGDVKRLLTRAMEDTTPITLEHILKYVEMSFVIVVRSVRIVVCTNNAK